MVLSLGLGYFLVLDLLLCYKGTRKPFIASTTIPPTPPPPPPLLFQGVVRSPLVHLAASYRLVFPWPRFKRNLQLNLRDIDIDSQHQHPRVHDLYLLKSTAQINSSNQMASIASHSLLPLENFVWYLYRRLEIP